MKRSLADHYRRLVGEGISWALLFHSRVFLLFPRRISSLRKKLSSVFGYFINVSEYTMLFSKLIFASAIAATIDAAAVIEARATNTNLQTAFPASTGSSLLAAATTIAASATFDGAMKKFDRSGRSHNTHSDAHLTVLQMLTNMIFQYLPAMTKLKGAIRMPFLFYKPELSSPTLSLVQIMAKGCIASALARSTTSGGSTSAKMLRLSNKHLEHHTSTVVARNPLQTRSFSTMEVELSQ